MTGPIRVLLVDDDPLVLSGLTMMLAGARNINIVGEAHDGRGVLPAVDLPDAGQLPEAAGRTVYRVIQEGLTNARKHAPGAPVQVRVTAGGQAVTAEVISRRRPVLAAPGAGAPAGAAGFLLKDTAPADIVAAIQAVHAGDGSLSPAIARRLIALVAGDPGTVARQEQARRQLASLTPREHQVAAAIAHGHPNADIAAQLHMSLATVKAHVSRLLAKLGAENRVQIALLVQDAAASRPHDTR